MEHLSVGQYGGCNVAKGLIGSGCRLGLVSGISRGMGVLNGVEIIKGEGAVLGVNVGQME